MAPEHPLSSLSSGDHESTTPCGAQEAFQLPTYNVTGGVAQVRQDPPQFKDFALLPLVETTLSPRVDTSFTILDTRRVNHVGIVGDQTL